MNNNEKIRDIIVARRNELGISLSEMARRLNIPKSTLSRYENLKHQYPLDEIQNFSSVLDLDPKYILGLNQISSIDELYNQLEPERQKIVYDTAKEQLYEQETVNKKVVPLVGKSAANPAVLEYGDIDIEQQSFSHVPDNADCAINIQGNSMEPLIKNGSIVFYKKQCDVENGEIAIVEIDGDGVTCKKVIKDYENKRIILRSINKKYDDRILSTEEIRIIGKVVM